MTSSLSRSHWTRAVDVARRIAGVGVLAAGMLLALPAAAQNEAPEAVNLGPFSLDRGATRVIRSADLLVTDPDSDIAVTYELVVPPGEGTLLLDGAPLGIGGTFSQTAINGNRISYVAAAMPGVLDDALGLVVRDGEGAALGSPAAPLVFPIALLNALPRAQASIFEVDEDGELLGYLDPTDADGDGILCTLAGDPSLGRAESSPGDSCEFTYIPNPDATGTDQVLFRLDDGFVDDPVLAVVTVRITPVNDAPVAVDSSLPVKFNTAADGTLLAIDPDGDPLTFTILEPPTAGSVEIVDVGSGRFRYTPALDATGDDAFTFSVVEADLPDAEASTARVTLTISGTPNAPPVALPGSLTMLEDAAIDDASVRGRLEASDADGDRLVFRLDPSRPAAKGAVQILDEIAGDYRYVPDIDASGPDEFYFRVWDGSALSGPARVRIEIRAVNDAPTVEGEPPTILDSGEAFDFLPDIDDRDGDPLTITIEGCPQWFDVCDPLTGRVAGTPATDGSDAGRGEPVVIAVSDGTESASLTFTVDVRGIEPITRAQPGGGVYNTPQFVSLICETEGGAAGCETFYTLDPGAGIQDFEPHDGEPIAVAATAQLRYYSLANGQIEPTRSESYEIDEAVPTLGIEDPTPQPLPMLDFPTLIRGTVNDAGSGVENVVLTVRGGGGFLAEVAGLPEPELSPRPSTLVVPVDPADGSWEFPLPVRTWPTGAWSVEARATDRAGNQAVPAVVNFDYVDASTTAFTRLTASPSTPTVQPGGAIRIDGTVLRLPDDGLPLPALPLLVEVTDPDDAIVSSQTVPTSDGQGGFSVDLTGVLDRPGRFEVAISFGGNDDLAPAATALTVLVGESAGYAIIVQGRNESGEGLESHNLTLSRVYDTLRARGFDDESIRYFNHDTGQPGVDALPSSGALREAIVGWARERLLGAPAPLYVVFVGHAAPGELLVDGADRVLPSDLALWLAELEEELPPQALEVPRVVVLGGCYTEGFIPELSAPGRVLIASAGADEQSYRGPLEDLIDNPNPGPGQPATVPLRSGELFVELLFKRLAADRSLADAYEEARALIEIFTQRGGTPNATRYLDTSVQHPFLDDDGNGKASNLLAGTRGDGGVAAGLFLGIAQADSAPRAADEDEVEARFVEVTDTLRLGDGNEEADLFAVAADPRRVDVAWAEIRAPSVVLQGQDGATLQLENELVKVFLDRDLEDAPDRYRAVCSADATTNSDDACFPEPGRYEVYYFARDAFTDAVSELRRSLVYVDRPGNRPPEAFGLRAPLDGAPVLPAVVLQWEEAVDPDRDPGVRYAVELSMDPDFVGDRLRVEDLRTTAVALGIDDGLVPGMRYYWRVAAVDAYGARRISEDTGEFQVAEGPERGVVSGVVVADATSLPVPGALVTSGLAQTEAGPQGRFLLALPPGDATVAAQALGFAAADVPGVEVVAGETTRIVIEMDTSEISVVNTLIETDEDTPVAGQIQAQGNGGGVTFELDGLPGSGVVSGPDFATTGAFSYTPNENFNGTDSFRVVVRGPGGVNTAAGVVTVLVLPRNDAPELVPPAALNLPDLLLGAPPTQGVAVSELVTGRVTDVDDDAETGIAIVGRDITLGRWEFSTDNGVRWQAVPTSSEASATLLDASFGNRLRFVPEAPGETRLSFRLWDTSEGVSGASGIDTRAAGGTSAYSVDSAELTLAVRTDGGVPTALPLSFSVNAGETFVGVLPATGTVGQAGRRFSRISYPTKGTFRLLSRQTGQFSYAPAAGRSGTDSFSFGVGTRRTVTSVAVARIDIVAVNVPPISTDASVSLSVGRSVMVRPEVSDANGDALTYTLDATQSQFNCGSLAAPVPGGALSEPPILTYEAEAAAACLGDRIVLTASDGSASASVTIAVTVTDVPNEPPVAISAAFVTAEEQEYRGTLQATDAEGDAIVYEILGGQSAGSVTLLHPQTGRFSYVPDRDATGADSFSFRARDADGASVPVLVNVTITPVDDPPALTGTPAPSVSAGDFYSFTPTLVDPDEGDVPVFECTNCPVWADFDPASGTLQGVPETGQEGLYPDIRLRVTTAGESADLAPFEIQVLADSGPPQVVRSVADGEYDRPQEVNLTCFDLAGGECEIFYTLQDPAVPPVFEASSALRAGGGLQIRGEIVGGSVGVSTSASFSLSHVVAQPGAVGVASSARHRVTAGAVSADSDGDGTPDLYDLFPTDPAPYERYEGPIVVDGSATLRFFARDEGGNVGPVTTTGYVIDTDGPEIVIDAPAASREPGSTERILWINGSVSDAGGTGVESLEVEIRDEAGRFVSPAGVGDDPVSLPAVLEDGGEWLLFTGGIDWQPDTTYVVTARAVDRAGNLGELSRYVSLGPPVQAFTQLSLELDALRVLIDGEVTLAGRLTRLPDVGLPVAGLPIEVTVLDPLGGTLERFTTRTRDELGSYRVDDLGGFVLKGAHEIVARFEETPYLSASEARQRLDVASAAGTAVLVQGKSDGAPADAGHALALERVREALLARGFTDDDIQFLAHGAEPFQDDVASLASLEHALTTWAPGRLAAKPGPLLLVLVGPGEPDAFAMDVDLLTPQDLDGWLRALEEADLPPGALDDPRTTVIAANAAGSFLPALSAPDRIVVTSTGAGEGAFAGFEEPTAQATASLFLNELMVRWAEGTALDAAFSSAAATLRRLSRAGGDGEGGDDARQAPLLDDDGDGEGSGSASVLASDGALASERILGVGRPALRLGVAAVPETITLPEDGTSALLWARLGDGTPQGEPWAVVRSPSVRVGPVVGPRQAPLPLVRVPLTRFNAAADRYEADFDGFDEPGRYEIDYQVLDARDGSLSLLRPAVVYRDRPDNAAPDAFALLSPIGNAETGLVPAFGWEAATDPDGDAVSYTLEIALDESFQAPVFRAEGILEPAYVLREVDALRDLGSYLWRVIAVDRWGAERVSDVGRFRTNSTNPEPVFVEVVVRSSVDGTPVPFASATFEPVTPGPGLFTQFFFANIDGAVREQVIPAMYDVTVSFGDFDDVLVRVDVSNGECLTQSQPQIIAATCTEVLIGPAASVDLVVALSVAPGTPRVGDAIDYQVTVSNTGPETATGVVVAADIAGTPVTVGTAPGCAPDAVPLVCDLPDIPAGDSEVLTVTATPSQASPEMLYIVGATANEMDMNPEDNEGIAIAVAVLDSDNDGLPDDEDTENPNVADISWALVPGLNLISVPVVPPTGLSASELLATIGPEANRVARYDPLARTWEVYDAVAGGTDFAIGPNEGLSLTMAAAGVGEVLGDPAPRTVNLLDGVNLVGFPVETGGDAFALLEQLRTAAAAVGAEVLNVATYDLASGRYRTAAIDATGALVGEAFPVRRGVAYYVTVRGDVPGFEWQ